jgi:hypothetical protein
MIAPDLALSHGWLMLFSAAPTGSFRGLIEGSIWSAIVGWLIAVMLGFIYNRLV